MTPKSSLWLFEFKTKLRINSREDSDAFWKSQNRFLEQFFSPQLYSRTKASAITATNKRQSALICTFYTLSIFNQISTWKQPYTFRGKQTRKPCGSTASRSRWYTRLSPPAQIGITAFPGRPEEASEGLPE